MSISVKHATVKPGAEITVDIAISNASTQGIHIWRARSGPTPYTFVVADRNGKAAPLTPMGQSIADGTFVFKGRNGETRVIGGGNGSSAPVAAGATLNDSVVISDLVDLSRPGRYTLRLKREDPHTRLPVESNSVILTVAELE